MLLGRIRILVLCAAVTACQSIGESEHEGTLRIEAHEPDWSQEAGRFLFSARIVGSMDQAARASVVFQRRLPPGQDAPPHQLQAAAELRDPGQFTADASTFGPFLDTQVIDYHWIVAMQLQNSEDRLLARSPAKSFQVGAAGRDADAWLAREQAALGAAFAGQWTAERIQSFGYLPRDGLACRRGLGVAFWRAELAVEARIPPDHVPALDQPDFLFFAPDPARLGQSYVWIGWGYAAPAGAERPRLGLLPYHEWMRSADTWVIHVWAEPSGAPRIGMYCERLEDGTPLPAGTFAYPPGQP